MVCLCGGVGWGGVGLGGCVGVGGGRGEGREWVGGVGEEGVGVLTAW